MFYEQAKMNKISNSSCNSPRLDTTQSNIVKPIYSPDFGSTTSVIDEEAR